MADLSTRSQDLVCTASRRHRRAILNSVLFARCCRIASAQPFLPIMVKSGASGFRGVSKLLNVDANTPQEAGHLDDHLENLRYVEWDGCSNQRHLRLYAADRPRAKAECRLTLDLSACSLLIAVHISRAVSRVSILTASDQLLGRKFFSSTVASSPSSNGMPPFLKFPFHDKFVHLRFALAALLPLR